MIKLLGFRRTLILGILLAINVLFAAAYFLWSSPQTAQLNTQLLGLRSEISTLQTGIQNTKTDMQVLEENLPFYDTLLKSGFVQEQDRFGMSRALEDIKLKANIQGFSFSVGDIRELQNADAQLAGKRLLHSRVEIDRITTVTDVNLFDLMTLIEKEFPIHARIHQFTLSRVGTLSQEVLTRISEGPFALLNAKITFDWFSLGEVPQDTGVAPVAPGGF